MDNKALTLEWLRFARMDLDSARYLLQTMHPAPLEIICYHCQQAAEKFLKSIAVALGDDPVKTHDLLKVLDQYQARIDIPREIIVIAGSLTPFGVRIRYPQELAVDEAQTRTALAQAEAVQEWVTSLLDACPR